MFLYLGYTVIKAHFFPYSYTLALFLLWCVSGIKMMKISHKIDQWHSILNMQTVLKSLQKNLYD